MEERKVDVANLVRLPGAFMAAVALLQILTTITLLVSFWLADMESVVRRVIETVSPGADVPVDTDSFLSPVSLSFDLGSVVLSAVIVAGGLSMMSRRRWGLALAAAILSLIPCTSPCCCLGVPVGVWALIVLLKPEVREAMKG